MSNIFISYSSKDMHVVLEFNNKLQETGHTIFTATYHIEGGKLFRDIIQEKLNSTDVFIALISNNFLNSNEAKSELNYAIGLVDKKNIKILSVLIDDIPYEELPFYVANRQYLVYQSLDRLIEKILIELSENHLSSPEAFERYLNTKHLTHEELFLLGKRAIETSWAENDLGIGIITRRIISVFKNDKKLEEALILYSKYIDKIPRRDSFWIARSIIKADMGNFQGADNDCVFVINRNPTNVIALIRRVNLNHAWALSITEQQEYQTHLQIIRDCIDKLNNIPSTRTTYLSGFLHALAMASEICNESSYANIARTLIRDQNSIIINEKHGKAQDAILKCLMTLERVYKNIGEIDTIKELKKLREDLENKWHKYHKRDY